MRHAMTAPQMAMIEPTERSMPFVPMTTAIPSATVAVGIAPIENVDQAAEQPTLDDPNGEKAGRDEPVDHQDQRERKRRPDHSVAQQRFHAFGR